MIVNLYDPGFVPVIGLRPIDVSYSLNVEGVGQFSMILDRRQIPIGPESDLFNYIVVIQSKEHRDPFCGVIRDDSMNAGDLMLEVSGSTPEVLLKDRVVTGEQMSGRSAGNMAEALIKIAENDQPLMITSYVTDNTLGPVEWQGGEQTLDAAISDVAQAAGHEWRVITPDGSSLRLEFLRRIGSDQRQTVVLYEGTHILSGPYSRTREGMATSIFAIGGTQGGGGEQQRRDFKMRISDKNAIRDHGRIQVVKTYYGQLTNASIRTAALTDIAKLRYPQDSATFELRNVGGLYSTIGIGDIVSVVLKGMKDVIPMRIMTMSVDAYGSLSASLRGYHEDEVI